MYIMITNPINVIQLKGGQLCKTSKIPQHIAPWGWAAELNMKI